MNNNHTAQTIASWALEVCMHGSFKAMHYAWPNPREPNTLVEDVTAVLEANAGLFHRWRLSGTDAVGGMSRVDVYVLAEGVTFDQLCDAVRVGLER